MLLDCDMSQRLTEKHCFELQHGNYKLYHVVKSGGSSTIYQGEHIHLQHPVAVKVLNSWLASEEVTHKFWAEARLHASMRHPHIVRVLDCGVKGKLPFFVMDYAPHGTLQDYYVTGSKLPLSTLLPLVMQIASALQYLHERNLVHRDVKPSNLLIGPENQIWLSDFGITVAMQPWHPQHMQDSIGTALYAAPEQISGKPVTASDQYALAVLVYTWLCGQPPFSGSLVQLCQQHLYNEPPSLSKHLPQLAPAVEQVVLRALSKDPYQRFAHVLDFANALKQACTQPLAREEPVGPGL
ncbi:serine/threonine protein kinase [Tengunoibacter tsumagoiensis]|uniref:non-specific serine/threonine protein kinase n=1 Tax=Tengunoibacter tsumagoiensis TaxID=2014871 RepID=A0A401ZVY9_9CHLR|nr:serine/threonine-protein kinase [Tengunoibacter tsumagoiensis]GCE11069.1 hypothetical protein KTT_09280 [Tengunoibacter tsumagoiensis]